MATTWDPKSEPKPLSVCAFAQQQKNAPIVMIEAAMGKKESNGLKPKQHAYFVQPMQLCFNLRGDDKTSDDVLFGSVRAVGEKTKMNTDTASDYPLLTRANFIGVSVGANSKADSDTHVASRRFACAVSGVAAVMVPHAWLKLMPVGSLVRGVICSNEEKDNVMLSNSEDNYVPAGSAKTVCNAKHTGYIFPYPIANCKENTAELDDYAIGRVVEHPSNKFKENWVKIALL